MLVSKKPCVPNTTSYLPKATPRLPNATPRLPHTTSNTSQRNIVHVGYARVWFALALNISCCLCQFRSHWVAKANANSGGIWPFVWHRLYSTCHTIAPTVFTNNLIAPRVCLMSPSPLLTFPASAPFQCPLHISCRVDYSSH